jgi:hypothetical protein
MLLGWLLGGLVLAGKIRLGYSVDPHGVLGKATPLSLLTRYQGRAKLPPIIPFFSITNTYYHSSYTEIEPQSLEA